MARLGVEPAEMTACAGTVTTTQFRLLQCVTGLKKKLPNWDISDCSHSGSVLGYVNEGDRKVHAAKNFGRVARNSEMQRSK